MPPSGVGHWPLLLAGGVILLAACSGTTAVVGSRDIRVQPRQAPVVMGTLGEITVTSREGTFDSDYERTNYARSLRTVLEYANLFGHEADKPYQLAVSIESFSIPAASFAGFNSTLDVRYELRDAAGTVVYQDVVQSAGADDTGATLGPVRQDRSRTRAVAENMSSLVPRLAVKLEQHARATAPPPPPAPAPLLAAQPPSRPSLDLPVVDVKGQSGEGIAFGRYHALVIGNDRYQHIQPLRSARRDARRLEAVLRTDYGFATRLLEDATRDEILGALTEYRRTLGPGDNLVVYYAGHGWVDKDEDEGYWLPVDARSDDPVRWLSNSTLTSTIRAMRAKHVLVIADSCFSGKLTRGVNPAIRTRDYLARMAQRQARTALTSGGLEPVLDSGGQAGHSVFATALFKALAANEGVIDMSQMFSFIRREVALHAEQFPEYGDIRQAGHDGGDFLFVRLPPK
jgi:uncharacterized caspase-like protein